MKIGKKLVLVSAMAIILTFGFCLPASAGIGKKVVPINEVAVDDFGVVTIKVTKPNGSKIKFAVPATEKNQMMAVALTAISLNKMVTVEVDWGASMNEIVSITLMNQ